MRRQTSASDIALTTLAVIIAITVAIPVVAWVMVLQPILKLATRRWR